MPFTLAHPAAVLPLMRTPLVPAALVSGSMAPDIPYFLTAAGLTSTSADDWYGSFLNATHTHSPSGLPIDLLYAVALVAAYWTVRAPITALLPPSLSLPAPERPTSLSAKTRYGGWLLLSALTGIATHLLWDALTDADFAPGRLLQYASTAFGLAAVGWFLWKRRAQLRTADDTTRHLSTAMRQLVVALLIAAPLLAGLALARDDHNAYRTVEQVDYSAVAEGVLTGAAKRAGASFAIALLLYAATWHLTASRRLSGAGGLGESDGSAGWG